MNFTEMVDAANRRADDTYDDMGDWINEGYLELAKVARIPDTSAISLAAGELLALPAGLIEIDEVRLTSYNGSAVEKRYQVLDLIAIEKIDDDTGQPEYVYRDGESIGFYPEADAAIEGTLYYFTHGTALSGTEEPDARIPECYHKALVNFGIARAKEQEEEYNEADRYMGYFEADKAALKRERELLTARPRTVRARTYA